MWYISFPQNTYLDGEYQIGSVTICRTNHKMTFYVQNAQEGNTLHMWQMQVENEHYSVFNWIN